MNGLERIKCALELKQADQIPLAEFGVDKKVFKQIKPDVDTEGDFQAAMDMDAVCCGIDFFPVKENSDGTFIDEWGVTYKPNPEMKHHPIDYPIKSPDHLDSYKIPEPDKKGRLGDLPDLVRKYKGDKAVVFGQRACFMWSAYIRGMDNLLMDFLVNPDFTNRLLDMVLELHIKTALNALNEGADIILLLDDYATNAGPLFSPQIFKDFIQPRLTKIINVIHENGGKVIKHSDGNLLPIIDMIIQAGVDGIHPIDTIAGMDIGYIKQNYGDKICVVGNVDCGQLLTFGNEQEVEQAVKECINKASYGGGHIITSSNSIHSSVKPENYLAMLNAVKKYGKIY
jgi:uroporphyrinogen decarboxylase